MTENLNYQDCLLNRDKVSYLLRNTNVFDKRSKKKVTNKVLVR